MATFKTDDGEVERPLIFTDPELTKQMAEWRDFFEKAFGPSDHELVGLGQGPDGEWTGIFRKKS